MKNKMGILLIAVLVFAAFSTGCKKTAVGEKTSGISPEIQENFSADFKFMSKAENFAGKIFSSKDKTRMETPEATIITRADKNVVWVLMPGEKMYVEYPLQTKNTVAGFHKLPNEVERKFIAAETVNGQKADKYQVTYTVGSKQDTIYQWIVSGKGLPIKTAAVDNSWSYEYNNVEPSTPEPSIFEVPDPYKKFDMPSHEDITHY